MHSRPRFILNLLPLLQNASSLRRVVSVAAATLEGPIDTDNMTAQGFPLRQRRDQMSSIQTLLLEEAARRAPDVSFVHNLPGLVKGGITRDAEGLGMNVLIALTRLLEPFLQTPPTECGERQLFLATSGMFPPSRGGAAMAGVPFNGEMESAIGSNGEKGSGVYSVNQRCDSASPRVVTLLSQFRKDGTAQMVWQYVAADFKRITGTEVSP